MAKLVGVVSKVVGEVFALGSDGSRRPLIEGDRLFAGEQLETGAAGAVAVRLQSGGELTLGRDSIRQMTADLLTHHAHPVHSQDASPSAAQLTDVERIQQAIAAGADPSETSEAPAAGPDGAAAPGALGGGHSVVMLTEVAARVDPVVGFPTAGFNGTPELANRYVGDLGNGRALRAGDSGGGTDGGLPPGQPNPPGEPNPPLTPTDENHPVQLRGLELNPGDPGLDEANLPLGSASNPAALTQHGSFTVVAPDGVFNLTLGGISVVTAGVVTGVGQSITTALGNILTITGYDPATGVVSYSYTLTGAEQHAEGAGTNSLSEHFPVFVSDTDGDTAQGTLQISIRDDVPTAVDDSHPFSATELRTELTGNVLSNDVQGADRVPGGPVIAGTFVGTYGTLILAADGSYTYTLNTGGLGFKNLGGGGHGVESFTYTIKDADGDTSSATLTLNISNLDDPVTLDGLDAQGGELTLHEKHLHDGSAPDASALTQQGTFKVTAPDGLQSLTVGGISVISAGVAAGFAQSIVTAQGNTLTITGYDPATGVVSYSYTLVGNESHPSGQGSNSISEHFQVIAKDVDGSTATGSLDVNIVDDVPTANSDYVSVAKGDVVRGNVMLNDVVGADTRGDGQYVVGVRAGSDTSTSAIGQLNTQVHGQYGYLTIDAYGNAEYHSDPTIASPRDALETFVYTIRDADGDESTTTITINVHNGLIACADHDVTVYEKALDLIKDGNDLAAGTVTGSDPGSTLETASGTLVGSASGGVGALTFSLVGSAVGQYGQIQLNADGSYTYTLTSPANSPIHTNDGANTVTETFTYQVGDSLGNSTTSTIVISIVDDVPTANSDYVSVAKGDVVRGNVMLNDVVGADTRSDGQYVVGVRAGSDTSTSAIGQLNTQVHGQYGYLTIDAYGNAEYHSDPTIASPRDALETFVYTIRDADGDESTTTITINVHNGLIACADHDVTVYEKALDLIKDGNDLAAGTVTGSDPGSTLETASGTLVGSASGGVGALTFSLVGSAVGQYGQIQLNADGSYTYTLTSPANSPTHANDGANTVTETFTYQVRDSLGNSTTSTIVISIVDDVPTANSDYVSVGKGDVVRGNVMLNDVVGADTRSDGQYVVGVRAGSDTSTSAIGQLNTQVHGQYGYLTIDAYGNAEYHSDPTIASPRDALETFVYTIRDADGDESTTTITINVHNGLIACADHDVTVYEKALDLIKDGNDLAAGTVTGSDPGSTLETASGTLVGSASGGVGALTFSLVGSAVGQYGQIQLNADGSYTYTLTSPANSPTHANDGANTVTETFTYQVRDSLGNSTTSTIVISIVDDVPTANSDYVSVGKGDVVRGNVMLNDVVGADTRSDGQYVVGVRAGSDTSTSAIGQLNTQVHGQYGYLTIDAYGNAEYHSNPDAVAPRDALETFVYTIRDADGDESTTTLTINVHTHSLEPCGDGGVKVYESALDLIKDGNDLAAGTVTGSDPTSPRETAIGSLVGQVAGGVGALTYTLVGNAVGQYGQIHLNADGSYTYTLTSPANSPTHANDGANTVTESFTYRVEDTVGNWTTSTVTITIVDDVPQAHCDYVSVGKGDVVRGNVMLNDVVGADTRGDGQYVVGVRAGSDTSTSAIGQLNTQVHGQYGYLTIDAYGNAEYHSDPTIASPRDALETFVYTIRDADGDESTTTITINVHNGLIACADHDVTVYEKALDLIKDGNDLAAGTVTGSDPGSTLETASGTLVGSASGGVGALTFSLVGSAVGQYGQIQLNADGSYTYTLTSPANSPTHANDGANTVTETFTYQVRDSLGNSTTSTIVISIVDDVPTANSDYVSVGKGDVVRGNVMLNDVVGADTRSDGQYVVGVRAGSDTSTSAIGQLNTQVHGQYGYLTIDAYGNAEYHSNPDAVAPRDALETFVYTIRDADGDESTTTLTINVHTHSLEPCGDGGVKVYESALDLIKDGNDLAAGTVTGSDPTSPRETAIGSLVGQVAGGVGALTYTLVGNAVGQYGQIHLNADGSYTYTLTSPANSPTHANDGANTVTESFTYRVEDTVGNWTTSTVTITIVDDVPQAHCDYVSVGKGDVVRGNVLLNDVIGADVPSDCGYVVGVRAGHDTSTSAIGQLGSKVFGQYGYLTLDVQGNAVYHSDPDVVAPRDAVDRFVYTIRDGDGDESTTTITVNVHDNSISECGDGYGRGLEQRFVDRGAFTLDASSMTAALVVLGYLGASGAANAQGNADEVINISLRTGETLQLNQAHHDASLALAWKEAGGTYQAIAAGDSFTASHDGVYSIQVSDPVAASKGGESYQLSMVLDYARAPDAGVHAGAGVDPAAISPVGAMGVTSLVGHAPAGVEASATANYALAKEGVTIDLSHDGAQDTGSAGLESFNGIHNLVGSDYGDILIGNNGDNVLIGGGGNDVLKGGDGNDTLIGGVGDDSLTGGNGNDIFIWQKGDSGHDTVTDFTPGSDKLDLSQLLQGEHATASSLDDYLHFKVNGTGANVVSTIEVSSVAGAAPTQTIDLAGVDLAQHYGVTAGAGGVVSAGHDTATIINGMLDDHSLKVDTV